MGIGLAGTATAGPRGGAASECVSVEVVSSFRMYFASAPSAASRSTHSRWSLSRNDSGLSNPPPEIPVEEGECATDFDLSVTGHADFLRVLPLTEAPLTAVQGKFRSEAH